MSYFHLLATMILGVTSVSVPVPTFAQNSIDPLSFIGRSNDPTLGQRVIDNNRLTNHLLRALHQRALQERSSATQLEIERERTRQLELQLKLKQY